MLMPLLMVLLMVLRLMLATASPLRLITHMCPPPLRSLMRLLMRLLISKESSLVLDGTPYFFHGLSAASGAHWAASGAMRLTTATCVVTGSPRPPHWRLD
jgi:hypothetical protein